MFGFLFVQNYHQTILKLKNIKKISYTQFVGFLHGRPLQVNLPLCCARCQIQIINPIVIIEVINCNNPTYMF